MGFAAAVQQTKIMPFAIFFSTIMVWAKKMLYLPTCKKIGLQVFSGVCICSVSV
jgi:hypothetical protein